MASFTQSFKNTGYMQSSLNILLFFMSWGIWWSFFQLWLKKEAESGGLGFTNTQVGTLYSVNSIATLILMFIYGTMQDRIGYKRTLQVFIAAISALVGPFMIYVYEPLLRSNYMVGVVVGAVVLSAGFMAGVGLLEALAERFSRRYNFEYGQALMWGSFGYAIVALVAGFLFTINPHYNFWAGSALGLINGLCQVLWTVFLLIRPRPRPEDQCCVRRRGVPRPGCGTRGWNGRADGCRTPRYSPSPQTVPGPGW